MIRSIRIALLCSPLACGSADAPVGADSTSGTSTSVSTSTDSGATSTAAAATTAADASSSSAASTGTTGDATSTDTTTGDPIADAGCPDDAPPSWIACESFDAITDAPRQISQWNVAADGFAVEPAAGVDASPALRVRLQPGVMFGGWVTLRFGDGPDAPAIDTPEGRWDELWLRYRLRTGADWPGRQIGDVGEMIAMNGANWGIAADLNLQGDGGMRVHPFGWTCIFEGELACDGANDWVSGVQPIWNTAGTTQVFDAAHADTWQCFEAHMRLNTPGAADGEAHVWVDGVAEIEQLGVDWRGTWDDFGINAVRFTNYADPVNDPLDFFVDDVVVATERVGCQTRG